VVIDASVAAAWYLRSQATASATALYRRGESEQFFAPIHFAVEMRNVLLLGERRGTLAPGETNVLMTKLGVLVDIERGDAAVEADGALEIARQTGLKLYDAIYLAKALRDGMSLASRDGQLLTAAMAVGVDVFDARR
jgi:predicted nucleic acid-binding protein